MVLIVAVVRRVSAVLACELFQLILVPVALFGLSLECLLLLLLLSLGVQAGWGGGDDPPQASSINLS